MIKEILDKPYETHISSKKFSISSIGGCWRRKYLELRGEYKEEFSESLKRVFNIGNIFHRDIISELISKGNNGIHVISAETLIPEHPRISGRIDIIVSDGKELYVVDCKSSSAWTFGKLKEGEVSQQYKDQVLLYEYFTGIHKGLLLFIEKSKGEIFEVPVEYDEERAKILVREIEDFFTKYVEKNIEPPCCNGGMFGCKACGK